MALLIALLLKPFAQGTGAAILPGSFFLILVFGTRNIRVSACPQSRALSDRRRVATVALRFLADQRGLPTLEVLSQGLSFIAMIVAMVAMFSEVPRARSVSSALVMGASACTSLSAWPGRFLLFNLPAFAGLNFRFTGPSIRTASGTEAKFTEVLHFSFAALTTIGSSGEQVLTPMMRQLAGVESAMGQLYLAVLISRLVGFSTSGTPNQHSIPQGTPHTPIIRSFFLSEKSSVAHQGNPRVLRTMG